MKEKQEAFINYIKRVTSNEGTLVKVYIVWGAASLILFGFFGFYPVAKNFISNVKLVEEMYQNNLSLKKKIEELKEAKGKIEIVGSDVDILDRYLPNDFEAQTYLVDLSMLAGDAGYTLDKISFGKEKGGENSLTLGISGKGNLNELVKKIESSGRLMEIQSIRYSIGERSDTVNMNLKSFIMER